MNLERIEQSLANFATLLDKRGKGVQRGLLALALVNLVICIFFIWRHLDIFQIDHAGHIASAAAFTRGLFHWHNDRIFLGYIHGLFYPPLEDLILGSAISALDEPIGAYRLYLIALLVLYFSAALSLTRALPSWSVRCLFLFGFLLLFNIRKPHLMYYQGLSAVDLLMVGLSSQFLGAVFLFLLMRELLGVPRFGRLVIFISCSILSHIVIGLASLVLLLTAYLNTRNHIFLKAFIAALGICSFFLLPVFAYRSYLTAGTAFGAHPSFFYSLAAVGIVLNLRNAKARCFFIAAFLLFLPNAVGPWLQSTPFHLPGFHYYRFGIISLLFMLYGTAQTLDADLGFSTQRTLKGLFVLALWAMFARDFEIVRYDMRWARFDYQLETNELRAASEYGRTWIVEHDREIDFDISSFRSVTDPDYHSVNGLFWESSRTNALGASYIVNLLSPSGIVNAVNVTAELPCSIYACLLDHFIADYNIRYLGVDETLDYEYMPPWRLKCLSDIIAGRGTEQFALRPHGSMNLKSESYTILSVAERASMSAAGLSNQPIEYVLPAQVKGMENFQTALDKLDGRVHGAILFDRLQHCQRSTISRTVFLGAQELEQLRNTSGQPMLNLASIPSEGARFEKLEDGYFRITVPSDSPMLFRIKLSYLPGLELLDEAGRPLPLYDAYPHLLGYGSGTMYLRYRRTAVMKLGYGISGGTLILLIATFLLRRSARC